DFHVTGVQTCALPICRTHLRTVSAVGPNFSATETTASHCESQCCSASNTIRTARSRSSTGYFPGLFWSVMTPSSQGLEPARYSGRFRHQLIDSLVVSADGQAIDPLDGFLDGGAKLVGLVTAEILANPDYVQIEESIDPSIVAWIPTVEGMVAGFDGYEYAAGYLG